jgi:peptidyl-prolyl cis-trans isomerase B (cyclophilin B)
VPSRSRQRQLAKLAAQRQAGRKKQRRQRIVAGVIAGLVAIGGGTFAAVALLGGDDNPKTSASGTPTPPISPTATASASAATGGIACGGTKPAAADSVSSFNGKYSKAPDMSIDTKKKYLMTMKTSCGTIELTLDPAVAPNTVNSLVFLADEGLFDGTTFHRIVPGFVIQGGDPAGDGTGGPGYNVVDTPPPGAQYPVGTLAMAKTGADPNGTSGSQFFIVTDASAQQALAPGGTGQYAIAGAVTGGMSVVEKIAAVPVAGPSGDTPQQTVYIEKVTVKAV